MTITTEPYMKETYEEAFARAFSRFPSRVAERMAEVALERKLAARRITALTKRALVALDFCHASPTEDADE